MKNRGIIVFLIFVLLIGSVSAFFHNNNSSNSSSSSTANKTLENVQNVEEAIDLAYSCLEDKIEQKSSISLQEAIFGTLALGSDSKLNDVLDDEKGNKCWPKAGCKIKDTALVLLAYDRSGKNSDDIRDWLDSKSGSADNLIWYLQIDIASKVRSECNIKYGSENRKIIVNEDMTLSGSGGRCLSVSNSGFWLRVDDECYQETFETSCDQDFVTALAYQKTGGETIFITGQTSSAASSGTTEEKVNALCFKANGCDYEGTLWAALALKEAGEGAEGYLPYLFALAEDNKKFFPSAFLHLLRGGDDQYSEIVQSQKQGKFWEMTGGNGKFYDTALGMLSLQGKGAVELDNAQNYLLSIQGKDGCWNNDNIRDTAFLLYAGWQKAVSGGVNGGGSTLCEEAGKYCEFSDECLNSGGAVLNEFQCSVGKVCCSVNVQEQTCAEKRGIICSAGQQCSGSSVSSLDGSCCLASCQTIQEDSCPSFGGECKSSCDENEEEIAGTCTLSGGICCAEKEEKSLLWLWIVLIIGIILLVLAIIFRNKLRIWMFKFRRGARSSPIMRPAGPSLPPQLRRPMPNQRPIVRRPLSQADREMEETLRKLREMGK